VKGSSLKTIQIQDKPTAAVQPPIKIAGPAPSLPRLRSGNKMAGPSPRNSAADTLSEASTGSAAARLSSGEQRTFPADLRLSLDDQWPAASSAATPSAPRPLQKEHTGLAGMASDSACDQPPIPLSQHASISPRKSEGNAASKRSGSIILGRRRSSSSNSTNMDVESPWAGIGLEETMISHREVKVSTSI